MKNLLFLILLSLIFFETNAQNTDLGKFTFTAYEATAKFGSDTLDPGENWDSVGFNVVIDYKQDSITIFSPRVQKISLQYLGDPYALKDSSAFYYPMIGLDQDEDTVYILLAIYNVNPSYMKDHQIGTMRLSYTNGMKVYLRLTTPQTIEKENG